MKRAAAHEYLVDGAFVVEVKMALSDETYRNKIYPKLPSKDFKDIFEDEETSDIAFKVKGEIVKAHKCIIKSQAKNFYDMCEGYSIESPMAIDDVDMLPFRIMLRSLYGVDVYPEEWTEYFESILKATNKYGFDRLKGQAEAWYSKSIEFTIDSAIDKFMEADGNDFAIVRDAAKRFLIEHAEEILESEAFDRLHESVPLLKEVMAAALKNRKKRKRDDT